MVVKCFSQCYSPAFPRGETEEIECAVVQSFDGIFASSSNSCISSMPNLSPKILRADTAPSIGTSINACYGSDIGLFTGKKARI